MGRPTVKIELAAGDKERLEKVSRKWSEKSIYVDRARILLAKSRGEGMDDIGRRLGLSRMTVERCVYLYRDGGIDAVLAGVESKDRVDEGGMQTHGWVIDISSSDRMDEPTSSQESDTSMVRSLIYRLPAIVRSLGVSKREQVAERSRVGDIQPTPENVKPYGPQGDRAQVTHDVMILYMPFQVAIRAARLAPEEPKVEPASAADPASRLKIVPQMTKAEGIKALMRQGVTRSPGEQRKRGRGASMKILTSIDLATSKTRGYVRRKVTSYEFIEMLEELDSAYPKGHVIRLLLDRRMAHQAKATTKWLAERAGRFELVYCMEKGYLAESSDYLLPIG